MRRTLQVALCVAVAAMIAAPGAAPVPAISAARAALPPVLINEILAHTDPPQIDSIELHNPSVAAVGVGNWCLTDSPGDPCRYRLPAGAAVAPGGYLVLTRNDFGFGLSEMGETVVLTADAAGPYAGTEHKARFGASDNGVSLGRVVTSDGREHFPQAQAVTLGAPNSPPSLGPVVLGVIMYNPPGSGFEYVELVNTATTPQTLCDAGGTAASCWRLEGVQTGGYAFPAGFTMPGKSVAYVTDGDPAAFRAAYGVPASVQVTGHYTGSLSNSGENVTLARPALGTGTVNYVAVDEVTYSDVAPWPPEADGGGAALRRSRPDGFGQEPHNWQAGPALGDPPDAAVAGFAPRDLPGGTRELAWATDAEHSLLGFTLLYSADGVRANAVRVGPELLPAQGNPHFGARYAVVDGAPGVTGAYWLEAVGWKQDRRDVATIPAVLSERVYLPLIQ